MESPWDEDSDSNVRDAEWARMSEEFANAGYRDGITAGGEAAIQEGFDSGFADVGAPLGRDLGLLRGQSSALLAFASSQHAPSGVGEEEKQAIVLEAREIAAQLGNVRYSDIEPRDLEAEEHAKEHLETKVAEMEASGEMADKRQIEKLEDMMAKMATDGSATNGLNRPTMEDVYKLKIRLEALGRRLGLELNWC